ncbi:hypothetical protein D9V37_18260 [Nocardioides mangrovicus]|uniref:Sulfotransferase family protein n=1 Tax=Nocardioides mangrovicus TaxID=2478913 RepID=A0A3L8NY25_9ACTN|nr:hypothetical protein [Nocardioides mangrovicus]RLV48040.1 hypothetical protein D9V37_18260 [Nocardioides mangrovicus]
MARRVIVHVGVPKTGTSYVQDRLFNNPASLAAQGVVYPGERHDAHFLAALDLMQLTWGGLERQAVGAWDALAAQVREAEGTAIISHEILGFASPAHVERAVASFGDAEVDVVVSVRDLVRQIPAEWQENVKHRRVLGFEEFLEQIRDPARETLISSWFWGVQEVPQILHRWSAAAPPARTHVVTVPQPGAARDLLWHRFASVFGLDPDSLPEGTDRENTSLGVPETALLRRLNEQLNDVVPNERYRQFVREYLVHQTLSKQQTSARLGVSPQVHAWASDLSRDWAAGIAEGGYDVVGDVADLVPRDPLPWVDPDEPDEAEVADAGVRGLAAMTREAARLRDVEIELHAIIDDLDAALQRFRGTRTYRAKERLVRLADENPLARAGLGAFRAVRGR